MFKGVLGEHEGQSVWSGDDKLERRVVVFSKGVWRGYYINNMRIGFVFPRNSDNYSLLFI